MIELIVATVGAQALQLIIILITAVPAGFGLGVGLSAAKKAIKSFSDWRTNRKTETKHKDIIDEFVLVEQ